MRLGGRVAPPPEYDPSTCSVGTAGYSEFFIFLFNHKHDQHRTYNKELN